MKSQNNKKLTDSLKTRSFHVGGYSMLITAFVIIIAVIVNIVIGVIPNNYTQIDVSNERFFTLSEQTTEIVNALQDPVEIDWITQPGKEDKDLEKVLSRYTALSSKINLIKIDPDANPKVAAEYTDKLFNNSLIVKGKDNTRFVDYYDIYTADYSNYMETGQTETVFDGEGAVTAAINYVTTSNHPKVYSIMGHGEVALSSRFANAVKKQNIENEELSLVATNAIPDDAKAIIVNAPTADISAQEKDIILDYLKNGGSMLLMTNLLEDTELTNLEEVMSYYGASLEKGVVIEGDPGHCAYNQQYYLLPDFKFHKTTGPLMEKNIPVVMPLAQGIILSDDHPDSVSVTPILQTSAKSYSKIDGYTISTYDREDGDIDGPFTVAALFEDKISGDVKAHVAWFTSSTLVDDTVNEMVSGGNQDLFLNCLGWMCNQKDSDLSIHAKSLATNRLTITNEKVNYLTVMIVGVIPAIYLGLGIFTWARRRRK